MPELPEVETIRKNLICGSADVPSVIGMTLSGALILWERTLALPEPKLFVSRLPGQTIESLNRRGKYFVFRLSQDHLLVHLRMSGDLLLEKQSAPIDKYCRVYIYMDEEWRLSFNDMRKFGRVWLVDDPMAVIGDLGPEPLDPAFNGAELYRALQKRRRQLKPLLMDQRFIAGLGNIYTDEALHLSKLHPLTVSDQVSQSQASALLDSIRKALLAGIDHNGSSIDWIYRGGEHQKYFLVYDRKGEACKTCGSEIVKIVVGQRGTYFCPVCQPTRISN